MKLTECTWSEYRRGGIVTDTHGVKYEMPPKHETRILTWDGDGFASLVVRRENGEVEAARTYRLDARGIPAKICGAVEQGDLFSCGDDCAPKIGEPAKDGECVLTLRAEDGRTAVIDAASLEKAGRSDAVNKVRMLLGIGENKLWLVAENVRDLKPSTFAGMTGRPFRADELLRRKESDALKAARAKIVCHGPLLSCGWKTFSSGMMINSFTSTEREMVWGEGGEVLLHDRERRGVGPDGEESCESVYRVDGGTARAVLDLIERENFAAWEELPFDASREPVVYDSSYSEDGFLVYDDGERPVTVSVGAKAAAQNGGQYVTDEFRRLILLCRRPDCLLSGPEKKTTASEAPAWMNKNAAGAWTCPVCGADGLTGNFCAECGSPRIWICKECGSGNSGGKFCPECGRKRS